MNLAQGEKLVKLARQSVVSYFSKQEITDKEFKEKQGVFVTLLTTKHALRGCIGFPEPIYPLGEGVIKTARFAAFSDPRFIPLQKDELNEIIFEVSVLTKPALIKVKSSEEYLKKIEIGKDGLIVEEDSFRGLLLPNVASEYNWTVEEFLNQTCLKANLLEETWKEGQCKIYKFQTELFKEETPDGKVVKA